MHSWLWNEACEWCAFLWRTSILVMLAVINVVAIWILFVAQPLVLDGGRIVDSTVEPGKPFTVEWTGRKARWADRVCVAVQARTFLTDGIGQVVQFEAPSGYNDGAIREPRETYILPPHVSAGKGEAWHRVTYNCFALQNVTVQSPKIPIIIAGEEGRE